MPHVTQRQREELAYARSIVPAGRIRRPRNVLQYLPQHARQLRNVHRWRKSRRLKAAIPCLDRRARHRPVRAKHATDARLRLKPLVAPFAVIEKLASVRRHRFDSLMPTLGTGDGRIQVHNQTFLDRPARGALHQDIAQSKPEHRGDTSR